MPCREVVDSQGANFRVGRQERGGRLLGQSLAATLRGDMLGGQNGLSWRTAFCARFHASSFAASSSQSRRKATGTLSVSRQMRCHEAAFRDWQELADPGFTRVSAVPPANSADSFLAMRSEWRRAATVKGCGTPARRTHTRVDPPRPEDRCPTTLNICSHPRPNAIKLSKPDIMATQIDSQPNTSGVNNMEIFQNPCQHPRKHREFAALAWVYCNPSCQPF